jgi:predicted nucleotidyltransferase
MDSPEQSTRVEDPVPIRFRAALDALYRERLERAVLFGSRARGDARPASDYDVAVFLHDYTRPWTELGAISEATTHILLDTGTVICVLPLPAGAYRDRTIPINEIRLDGADL